MFSPSILVFWLVAILLFLKKYLRKKLENGITKFHRISQAVDPFHLWELSWTLLLKASSNYYPPQIPYLVETSNINGVPVLITRLENDNLSLQMSFCPIISPKSPLMNTLIRSVHHQKGFITPLMGCKTVLSHTTSLKSFWRPHEQSLTLSDQILEILWLM